MGNPPHVATGVPFEGAPNAFDSTSWACTHRQETYGNYFTGKSEEKQACHDAKFMVATSTVVGCRARNTINAQQMFYEWLKLAVDGGLRTMAVHALNNETKCAGAKSLKSYGCDDTRAIYRQLQSAYDMQAFIDHKFGGPGTGWYRIVTPSAEARHLASAGKLAVILGVEVEDPFGCTARAGACYA